MPNLVINLTYIGRDGLTYGWTAKVKPDEETFEIHNFIDGTITSVAEINEDDLETAIRVLLERSV